MNGGELKIYEKLGELEKSFNTMCQTQVAITTKVDLRHDENVRFQEDRKKEVDMMFKLLRDLPCKMHTERMAWLNRWITALGACVVVLGGWVAKLHIK